MRKITIMTKLSKTLDTLSAGCFGTPTIKDIADGFTQPTLCWDGPYEWVHFSIGQSFLAGELGNYSMDIEPALQKIVDLAKSNGYYFEPATPSQLCLAD